MEEVHYKKRIRLLSFQNAHNFGAVLQAYGLQQTIKTLGFTNVKFINYNPKYLSDRYNPFQKKYFLPNKTIKSTIFKYIKYPFFLISNIQRNRCFRKSINTMLDQTTKLVTVEKELKNEEVDILICGSDQIWNTSLTNDFDPVFLGRGPYKYIGYAASYAPSTELSSLTDEKAKALCGLLSNFKYLSVREKPVQEMLQKYTDKNISVCVDPTLLCGAESYYRICLSNPVKKNYILVYAYNPQEPSVLDAINSIPDVHQYAVHIILLGEKSIYDLFKKNYHSAITVQSFLSYFKYASYVVTNSFHGLAFSLLFEKEFNVVHCPGKHIRCLSLLEQLGLKERFVYQGETCSWNKLDYSVINKRLDVIRGDSMNYLKQVLGNEE